MLTNKIFHWALRLGPWALGSGPKGPGTWALGFGGFLGLGEGCMGVHGSVHSMTHKAFTVLRPPHKQVAASASWAEAAAGAAVRMMVPRGIVAL